MTTEDSTENMPNIAYLELSPKYIEGPLFGGWLDTKTCLTSTYYSQAELDRRVAEAEERQRERCEEAAKKEMDFLDGEISKEACGLILDAILNAGGKGDE